MKLTLASEDAIHSFYVPAFRIKPDVVPGQYETRWFQATPPRRYHLFCAEYCGTGHAAMGGWVTVMDPAAYENWLAGSPSGASMLEQGKKLFGAVWLCYLVWFFMNLRKSSSLNRLFAGAGFFWLAILIVFVLSDYFSRGWLPGGTWWK